MEAAFDDLSSSHVGVLCGRGNNGGDGFVVARTLVQRGVETSVFLLGRVAEVRGDARTNLEVLGRIGLTVVEIADAQEWELHFSEISRCELLVDALLGTGFHGQLSGLLETVVADVNGLGRAGRGDRSADGRVGRLTRSGRRGDRGVDDGHARGAEDSADPAAGRFPRRRSRDRRHRDSASGARRGRWSVHRAAHARAHARAGPGARRRLAQRGFRPRARGRRIARPRRRGPPGGDRRPQVRRRAGDDRHAAVVPPDRGGDGARVHDRAARRDDVGHDRLRRARARARDQGRHHRGGSRPRPGARHRRLRPGPRSSGRASRW